MRLWKFSGNIAASFPVFILITGLFVSCSSVGGGCPDEPAVSSARDSCRIEVYAGNASASFGNGATRGISGSVAGSCGVNNKVAATRAINEPSRLGYCKADRLHLWFFKSTGSKSIDNSVYNPPLSSENRIDYLQSGGVYNTMKYAICNYELSLAYNRYNTYYGFAIPSLAFESKDEDLYKTSFQTTSVYSDLILNINHDDASGYNSDLEGSANFTAEKRDGDRNYLYRTPELFYGFLKFSAKAEFWDGVKELVTLRDNSSAFYVYYPEGEADKSIKVDLYGKLYRIVSQWNVNVTEIDEQNVERIDLYFSNVPDKLKLSGNHGAFYNVEALQDCFVKVGNDDAADDAETFSLDNYIRVASTNEFSGGTAKLSCFLLPSLKGRRIGLRVYYKDGVGGYDGTSDSEHRYEDYAIEPLTNAFLYGEDADVYATGELSDVAELWQNGNLYVYNNHTNEFYSYANVRVNLTGRFSDLVGEKDPAGLDITVGSTFDDVHEIEL